MKSSDKPKLIVAGVIFLIAIVLIAYNFGLFGGGSSPNNTPQLKESAQGRGGPAAAPGAK